MLNISKLAFRLKIAFYYFFVKFKIFQALLPNRIKKSLPTGWNNQMFWVAFKSGGDKLYFDYYVKFKESIDYKPKAIVDLEYQLTEKDIEFFYENGYIGPFDLMPSDEAEQIKEHLVKLATKTESKIYSYSGNDFVFQDNGNQDNQNLPSNNHKQLKNENEEFVYERLNTKDRHLEDNVLLNLFKHPSVTERCAQLLGQNLILWRSQFFQKSPFSAGTKWHQASTWLFDNLQQSVVQPPDCEELFELTCWIALTDATKENGCMKLVAGSHKEIYPLKLKIEDKSKSDIEERIYGGYQADIDCQINPKDEKVIEMKAGQFFIFTERAIHGSLDNITDGWRWAVNGRISRTDTRIYTKKMLEEKHDIKTFGVKTLSLDKWKAVLIRGEDNFGYNRLLEEEVACKSL